MKDKYYILEDCVRKTYANVVWSHKIQEKQADVYSSRYKRLETAKIVIASFASCGVFSVVFTDELCVKIISAILSLGTLFITSYFKSFNLMNLTKIHKEAALEYLALRNELELLILSIHLREADVASIEEKYESIVNNKLNSIDSKAPSTTEKAVKKAREALNVKKDNTYTDSEIDSFLPKNLRRSIL